MLMITSIESGDSTRTLKIEGKLLGPWVDQLRELCDSSPTPPDRVRLDLAAVSYVDAAGADLLGELTRRGMTIAACSGFVAEILALGPS
jgi:hypothetical protein